MGDSSRTRPAAAAQPDEDWERWASWAQGVEDRLAAVETSQREVLREWREITIEWESFFEKFRNLYARLSRRDAREAQRTDSKEESRPINPAAARLLMGPQSHTEGGKA